MISTVTRKRKILFLIPFCILAGILMYTWLTFITTDYIAQVPHWLGLLLFLPIVFFLVKDQSLKKVIVLTGVYLLLATINAVAILPGLLSSSFGIVINKVEIYTPRLNGFALVFLIIYCAMNFDTLVDIYLDHKESKGKL